MGGEGKLNTRRGMGSSAAGSIQHSQVISCKPDRNHQDWCDPNDQESSTLVSRREQAHQRMLQTKSIRSTTAAYKDAYKLRQKRTRALKSDWWERKAVELLRDADRNNTKGFYNGLTEVWGPKKKGPVHLKSTHGMETFSDSKRVVTRRSEHFPKLLSVNGDIDHEALDNIPQRITKTSLDEIPAWIRWQSNRRTER